MAHEWMTGLARALVSILRPRAALLAENVLLRQQIIILGRAAPRPRLKARDRLAPAACADHGRQAITVRRIRRSSRRTLPPPRDRVVGRVTRRMTGPRLAQTVCPMVPQ